MDASKFCSVGPPGVGKTLTAECIADLYERPLYSVTSGDLGVDPETVEERLRDIFDYAVTWNAVLLLDEADVFLAERNLENLERNALVSGKSTTLDKENCTDRAQSSLGTSVRSTRFENAPGRRLTCPTEYFNGVFFHTTNRKSFLINELIVESKRRI